MNATLVRTMFAGIALCGIPTAILSADTTLLVCGSLSILIGMLGAALYNRPHASVSWDIGMRHEHTDPGTLVSTGEHTSHKAETSPHLSACGAHA